jgi:hypothetical protein
VQTFFGGAPTLLGNQSYERVPADQDTNSAADWIVRTSNTATPGLVTIPEPGSVSLVTFLGGVLALRRRRQGRDDRAAEDVPLSCGV